MLPFAHLSKSCATRAPALAANVAPMRTTGRDHVAAVTLIILRKTCESFRARQSVAT
jgi:hypothetical protein